MHIFTYPLIDITGARLKAVIFTIDLVDIWHCPPGQKPTRLDSFTKSEFNQVLFAGYNVNGALQINW